MFKNHAELSHTLWDVWHSWLLLIECQCCTHPALITVETKVHSQKIQTPYGRGTNQRLQERLDPSVALFSLYTKLNVMIKPKQFLTSAKKESSSSKEMYY